MSSQPDFGTTLLDRFRRGLSRNPDGIAVRAGETALTYRQLDEQARTLAGAILARVPAPTRVGVLAARGPVAYRGILAALYAGATIVPLNPEFPQARTAAMADAAQLSVLVVDGGQGAVTAPPGVLAHLPVVHADTAAEPVTGARPAEPGDPAYILFTSGSTGRPKGVPVTHRNVLHYLAVVAERYGFSPQDVFSQTFDLTFDLAMFDMFCAWGSGGTLATVPAGAMLDLPGFLARRGVTVWFSSPSAIALQRRGRGLAPGSMPTLRWSLFCGEALMRDDAAAWQAAAPNSVVENLYGPTELTISCSVYRWDDAISPALCVNDIVPIGELHDGLRYLLVDIEGEAGVGAGELCVTGAQMFPGYLDAGDDEGRFLVRDGVRWYRTGDLVRPHGAAGLAYLGRMDQQVNLNGVRIELAEVDWALRGCAGVDHAVTVVHGRSLVSFYTGTPRAQGVLMKELGEVLPRPMIPHQIRYLESWPLNANRKIDRKALAALAAEGKPEDGR